MLLLERKKLESGGTVVVDDERPIARLEELIVYAVQVGGHVDIAVPIRASQAARLRATAGSRHLTIRSASRVVVR